MSPLKPNPAVMTQSPQAKTIARLIEKVLGLLSHTTEMETETQIAVGEESQPRPR